MNFENISSYKEKIKEYSSFGEVLLKSEQAEKMTDVLNEYAKSGKFFSVEFLKKNGSLRKMQARTQVVKHLVGGDRKVSLNYLCVYDMQAKSYRSINPETILKINSIDM